MNDMLSLVAWAVARATAPKSENDESEVGLIKRVLLFMTVRTIGFYTIYRSDVVGLGNKVYYVDPLHNYITYVRERYPNMTKRQIRSIKRWEKYLLKIGDLYHAHKFNCGDMIPPTEFPDPEFNPWRDKL